MKVRIILMLAEHMREARRQHDATNSQPLRNDLRYHYQALWSAAMLLRE